MASETKSKFCERCKMPFTYLPVVMLGKEVFPKRFCEACCALHERELAERDEADTRRAHEEKWLTICPALYADTDAGKLHPRAAEAACAWDPAGSRGLGLLGITGAGKTRALFLAARKGFDAGLSVDAISHTRLAKLVQEATSGDGPQRKDARARLDRLGKVKVLILDDLGKPPPTERADAELEELVEIRVSHLLPVLWSTNGTAGWLEERLGPDRGPALVRRLCSFSETIAIDSPHDVARNPESLHPVPREGGSNGSKHTARDLPSEHANPGSSTPRYHA